jgi:hypothetical protein
MRSDQEVQVEVGSTRGLLHRAAGLDLGSSLPLILEIIVIRLIYLCTSQSHYFFNYLACFLELAEVNLKRT